MRVSELLRAAGILTGSACLQGRQAHVGRTDGIECWEEADASSFLVRGRSYPQTRKKVTSAPAIYRRVQCLASFLETLLLARTGQAVCPDCVVSADCDWSRPLSINQHLHSSSSMQVTCEQVSKDCGVFKTLWRCALTRAKMSCRLLGCDVYSFEFKINHIARHIRLPDAPSLGPAALALPPEERPPPLLVINVQLPMYPVRLLAEQHVAG